MNDKSNITWLLDADGVIFPESSKPGWGTAPRKVYIPINDGRVMRERYAPQLVKEIRQIIVSGKADVTWATTWCEEADKLEKFLYLPPLPRAFPSCAVGGLKEKTLAARRVVNSGRRLIWTDDVVVPKWGPLYDELTANNRSLLISPDPKKGLQPEDMEAIRSFIGIESFV